MKPMKKLLVLVAATVGALGTATAGWAYWTAAGTGSASASVGTLNAPTGVTASQPVLSEPTVHLTWDAPTGGVAPDGYFVERFDGAGAAPACSTSDESLITTLVCDDPVTATGPFTYRVTAVFRSWSAQSEASVPISVVLDATPPTVSSIVRADADPTNAASVRWTVTFSEPVSGVGATDFGLTRSGSVVGGSVSAVSGSGDSYTVTATTGAGDGTLRLDVVDDDTIVDATGNALGGIGAGNGDSAGQSYTVDRTPPSVTVTPVATPSNVNQPAFSGAYGFASGDNPAVTVNIHNGTGTGGIVVATATAALNTGTHTWSTPALATALTDGTYTVAATQADTAGNTATTTATFLIDTAAPVLGPLNETHSGKSGNGEISGTAGTLQANSSRSADDLTLSVKLYLGGSATGTPVDSGTATANASTGSFEYSYRLTNGIQYTATVTQTDGAGNTTIQTKTFTP